MLVVSDTDILSMFGKAGAVQQLKRLFGDIHIPPAVLKTHKGKGDRISFRG
jgi:predicted nucleic acid-binding protein